MDAFDDLTLEFNFNETYTDTFHETLDEKSERSKAMDAFRKQYPGVPVPLNADGSVAPKPNITPILKTKDAISKTATQKTTTRTSPRKKKTTQVVTS